MTGHDYDRDPAALAWARRRVQASIDKAKYQSEQAAASGNAEQAAGWRRIASHMQRSLIGGKGCIVAAFDERLPTILGPGEEGPR